MENGLRGEIEKELKHNIYVKSDTYLVNKWSGETYSIKLSERMRKKAYQNFSKAIENSRVANKQTIRRWFGLSGFTIPKRIHLIRMAFALNLNSEELREYLINTIGGPDLVLYDYEECIIKYALDNSLSHSVAISMSLEFEKKCEYNPIGKKQISRKSFLKKYKENMKKSPDSFLKWMYENRDYFMGFDKTTIDVYQDLLHCAMNSYRDNTLTFLYEELDEIGFFKTGHVMEAETIRQYIKNKLRKKRGLSHEKADEIRYFTNIVYSGRDRIKDVLREIYLFGEKLTSIEKNEIYRTLKDELPRLSEKYISEIQNKYSIKPEVTGAKCDLSKEIYHMLERRGFTPLVVCESEEKNIQKNNKNYNCNSENQEEEKETIFNIIYDFIEEENNENVNKLKENFKKKNQRLHYIKRADLLIPLQYIIVKKYQIVNKIGENPDIVRIRQEYIKEANKLLEKCDMHAIDSKYALDYCLIRCFGDEEIVLFSELME